MGCTVSSAALQDMGKGLFSPPARLTTPEDAHTATSPTDAHTTATLLTPYLPRRLTAPAWRRGGERGEGWEEGLSRQPELGQLEKPYPFCGIRPRRTVKFADDKLSL